MRGFVDGLGVLSWLCQALSSGPDQIGSGVLPVLPVSRRAFLGKQQGDDPVSTETMVSGRDIRDGYLSQKSDTAERVTLHLRRHGPSSASEIRRNIESGIAMTEVLARIVDDGTVVAVRKPTTARGGRPGITYRLA